MFLSARAVRRVSSGFPRMRGDVPRWADFPLSPHEFSPHARGCSVPAVVAQVVVVVFPACAGMFLRAVAVRGGGQRFPRMRGDVPRP